MTISKKLLLTAALAATFFLPVKASFAQPAAAAKTASKAVAAAPSAQDIADAKAKGMVWVNLNTKVYHKEGRYYGATKSGKFMTEADAQKAGYKAAQEPTVGKKKASKAAPAAAPAKN